MTTIVFIERDDSFRELLAAVFSTSGRYHVVGSYTNADVALRAMPGSGVDVILIDPYLPGDTGLTVLRRISEKYLRSRCVVLTSVGEDDHLFSALEAGAAGYLLKTDSKEEIVAAVDELLAGGVALSRPIARRVLGSFSRPRRENDELPITERERDIMDQLAAGRTSKEIGKHLGISAATVKNHLYRIYDKLGVRSRTEAVVKWMNRKRSNPA